MPTRGVRPRGRGRAPAPVPPPSLVGHARASTRIGNQVQSGTPGRSPVAHLQLGARDPGAGTSLQVGVCSLVGQARAPAGCADESGRARPGRCPATPESGGAAESDGCPGSRSPVGGCCFVPRRPGSAPARQKKGGFHLPQISTPQCWCRTRVFVRGPSNNNQTCTRRARSRSYHTRQLPTCGRAPDCTLNQTFFYSF